MVLDVIKFSNKIQKLNKQDNFNVLYIDDLRISAEE